MKLQGRRSLISKSFDPYGLFWDTTWRSWCMRNNIPHNFHVKKHSIPSGVHRSLHAVQTFSRDATQFSWYVSISPSKTATFVASQLLFFLGYDAHSRRICITPGWNETSMASWHSFGTQAIFHISRLPTGKLDIFLMACRHSLVYITRHSWSVNIRQGYNWFLMASRHFFGIQCSFNRTFFLSILFRHEATFRACQHSSEKNPTFMASWHSFGIHCNLNGVSVFSRVYSTTFKAALLL